MAEYKVPPYPTEELAERISDGSVDLSRLAATVHAQQTSLTALVNWVNDQIQVSQAKPSARGAGSDKKSGG